MHASFGGDICISYYHDKKREGIISIPKTTQIKADHITSHRSAQVRLEEGCQELQEVSTFSQVETPMVAGAQLAGILVSCLLVTFLVVGALFWKLVGELSSQ